MSSIFESPDGGKTIYKREFGETHRTRVSGSDKAQVTVSMNSAQLNEFTNNCAKQNIQVLEVK